MGTLSLQENTYWGQVLGRLQLPRGGLSGGGSQFCTFEYEPPAQAVMDTILKGLTLHRRSTWDQGNWVPSQTIDTYAAETHQQLDKYLKLHARKSLAPERQQLYRSTRLLSPSTMQGQSVVVSACQPWLVEVCHRGRGRVVLVTQFRLFVLSDLDSISMPPTFQYAAGMDLQFRARALQHLKEMVRKCGAQPTEAFHALMGLHFYLASSSEESQEEGEEDIGWPESSDAPSDSASDAAEFSDLESEEEQVATSPHRRPSRLSQQTTHPRAAHKLN